MSELIKREDAINAVELFFKDSYIEDADVHCTEMVYEINHIPAASPWHRVEEELPKKEGDYLVWTMLYGGHAYTDYYTPKYGWDEYKVIAWMPLPEPPKEDA